MLKEVFGLKCHHIKVSNTMRIIWQGRSTRLYVKNQVLGVVTRGEVPTPRYGHDEVDAQLKSLMFV